MCGLVASHCGSLSYFDMYIVLLLCLLDPVDRCNYFVGAMVAGYYVSIWFVLCLLSFMVCLLTFLVSLLGYVL